MRQFFHSATDSYVGQGSAFMLDDTQYPANWIEHASVEEIAGLGLLEVVIVGERKDDALFDNFEILKDGVLTITSTPKDSELVRHTVVTEYTNAAQAALEVVAKSWGYDSVISICTYVNSTVQQFKSDAETFIEYRDSFWLSANNIKISVQNGAAMPLTSAEFVAMLPAAPNKPTV